MRIRLLASLAITAGLVAAAISMPVGGGARAEVCGLTWAPVCGVAKDHHRRTYANECWARVEGATHTRPGECRSKH